MSRGAASDVSDQRARGAHVDRVGEEYDQSTATLVCRQVPKGTSIVRLRHGRPNGNERVADGRERRFATLRRDESAHALIKDESAHTIARRGCDISEYERCRNRVFETGEGARELRHRA